MKKLLILITGLFILSTFIVNADLFDNIDSAYTLDGNLTDMTGVRPDLVNTSILTFTTTGCANGYCLDLDGTADFLTGYPRGWNSSWSASFWFKADTTVGVFRIVGIGEDADQSYWQGQIENNNLKGALKNTLNQNKYVGIAFTDTSNWHNMIIVYNQTDGKFRAWLDNSTLTTNDPLTETINTQNFTLMIGAHERASTQYFFNGKVDEIYMFNKALNYEERSALQDTFYTPPSYNPPNIDLNTDMNNTEHYKYINLTIAYNGTVTYATTDIFTCSLWNNNILINQSTDVNVSNNQYFNIDTSFLDEQWILMLNCSNAELHKNTTNYFYGMDTHIESTEGFLLYLKSNSDYILEVIEMITLALMYGILLFFGYWLIRTYNFWIGLPMLLMTMGFDIQWAILFNDYVILSMSFIVLAFGKIFMAYFLNRPIKRGS